MWPCPNQEKVPLKIKWIMDFLKCSFGHSSLARPSCTSCSPGRYAIEMLLNILGNPLFWKLDILKNQPWNQWNQHFVNFDEKLELSWKTWTLMKNLNFGKNLDIPNIKIAKIITNKIGGIFNSRSFIFFFCYLYIWF